MRKTKLYSNGYNGKYYMPCNTKINFKEASLEELTPKEVDEDNLKEGELYVIDNGSTVLYLGDNSFTAYDRTPLKAGYDIKDLNENCLRMFWTLVKNCKNGTSDGV